MKFFAGLITLVIIASANVSTACDNSSISIVNQTTNPDGSITYALDITVDHGGLDAVFYGFALEFVSSTGTPTVVIGGIYPTTTPISGATLTAGSLSGVLQGLTGGGINSVANDNDWNQFGSQTNVLSYESSELFGAISNDISMSINVTVMGCVEDILFYANVNSGAAACVYTVSTGQNCATCNTSALAAVPSACSNNTYSVSITVTYSNPPASGTLDVMGQSFPITSSPQTVVISGLTADGAPVNVTASFSADPLCTLTSNALYTAPASCTSCNANAGTFN
jgi:hypothetical protein